MNIPAVKQVLPARVQRANVLSLVKKGIQKRPIRLFIHGVPKVGKSTCAAGAPAPLFLPVDDGVDALDVDKLPKPASWDDAVSMVQSVADDPGPYKTFVIDPINMLEPLCWAKVTGGGNIDKYDGGYGKGYNAALDVWRILFAEVERVWQRGLNIIVVSHSIVKSTPNPEGPDYLHFVPAFKELAYGLFGGWVDAILFAQSEMSAKAEAGSRRGKGISTGARFLRTTWAAPWEAGNRWSLPESIPLGWTELESAIAEAESQAENLRTEIMSLAETLGADVAAKARSYINAAGSRTDRLREVHNALIIRSQQKEVST